MSETVPTDDHTEPEVEGFAMDGISRLVAVTQMKSSNANEDAMSAADRQRDLVRQQQSLRGLMSAYESKR